MGLRGGHPAFWDRTRRLRPPRASQAWATSALPHPSAEGHGCCCLLPASLCARAAFSAWGGEKKGGGRATIGLFQRPSGYVQATSGGARARSGAGSARSVARRLCLSLLHVPSTSDLQSLCPRPPRCLTHLLQAVCEGSVRAPGGFSLAGCWRSGWGRAGCRAQHRTCCTNPVS